MAVRIGIDVGGTFTDAVVLDNETFELIGSVKIPTTHDDRQGVAAGIINALNLALEKCHLSPKDVIFIAHATTQATNALLEGDVEKVGIIGLGKGLEGLKVKADTQIDKIELATNKFLETQHQFIDLGADWKRSVEEAVKKFAGDGIKVCVMSSAYSVDDPTDELKGKESADSLGMLTSCTHEISKLYGLKVRTRTSVINASILPKMLQTADMTQESVKKAKITAPLMIMRCDGGVMSVDEVKKRPILTMLSGPAAGVAGALMYEKISEGIFLEVGGTSTDISAIKNGKVMVDYAEVGGHKTYVSSLDVRTVAIAGGSMIRMSKTDIIDVGPRSAHIAGLPYLVYADPAQVSEDLEVCFVKPKEGDFADYVAIRDKKSDKKYALTLSCAANASGYVRDGNYSGGNAVLALKGFKLLSDVTGKTVEDILASVHAKAAAKNSKVVKQLIIDYNLDPTQLVLVGGGGGAAAVVPYLGIELGMKHKISKNAEVISPIGVALALVRDVVERTICNPTEEDILSVRREAEQAALKSGAAQATIEIVVEIDTKSNIVRATATGATELRTKDRYVSIKTEEEIKKIAADTLTLSPNLVEIEARTDGFCVCTAQITTKTCFGLFRKVTRVSWIIDREGVIRLHKKDARAFTVKAKDCVQMLEKKIQQYTDYNDGGEMIPECCLLINSRIADFSNLKISEQIISLLKIELSGVNDDEDVVIFLSGKRLSE